MSDLQPGRAGQAPAARAAVQEHDRGEPRAGAGDGVRGQHLRRRRPVPGHQPERRADDRLRHRPRLGSHPAEPATGRRTSRTSRHRRASCISPASSGTRRAYKISNKSDAARTVVIEHPNRTNQGFKAGEHRQAHRGDGRPCGGSRRRSRPGSRPSSRWSEERDLTEEVTLTNSNARTRSASSSI